MIVRVIIYEANSMDAADRWHRDRAAEIEEIVGLDHVQFIRQRKPPRAGAIMYFESPEDLRHYKASERYEWLQESMQESWAGGDEPVLETVYRVLEVPERAPSEL